jgi:hypothetical protein
VCCPLSCSCQATNRTPVRKTMFRTSFVILSLSSGPIGLCDYSSRFLAFFVFFSVFLCFSACRNKSVILALFGFWGVCPVSPLYCVCSGLPCSPSARVAVAVFYRGALCPFEGLRYALPVLVCLSVARCRCLSVARCRCLSVARCRCLSVAVCLSRRLALSGPLRVSNKCSISPLEQVFRTGVRACFLGISLSEFLTESDRILTES